MAGQRGAAAQAPPAGAGGPCAADGEEDPAPLLEAWERAGRPRRLAPTPRWAAAALLAGLLGLALLVCAPGRGAPPAAARPALAGLDRRAVVSLAAEAAKVKALLGAVGDRARGSLQTQKELRTASCVLDSLQASNYLARAGIQIDQATKTCGAPSLVGSPSAYKKEACAANAAGIFASIGFVATYLSLATSRCSAGGDVTAVCAAAIEGIVAALGGVAVQANFVAANCGASAGARAAANTATDAIWQMDARRLDAPVDGAFGPDRNAELATCILDVTEAATSLAQMGVNVQASKRGCRLWEATEKVPVLEKDTHAICAVTIGEVLFGAGQAATFIAAAVSHCAVGINVDALCAAGVSGLLTTLAGVVYLGSGINLGCVELPKLGPLQNPAAIVVGQGIVRRLGRNESAPGLV